MVIEQLNIYPVKSFPGVRVIKAEFNLNGLKGDRQYCLYTPDGIMQTRRNRSGMADFEIDFQEESLFIYSKRLNNSVCIDHQNSGNKANLKVWSRMVEGFEVSAEVNEFLSDHFNDKVNLYIIRKIEHKFASFHDDSPILICNRSSVRMIEATSGENIDIMRFRPNVVVDSGQFFDESKWSNVIYEEINWSPVKLCSRCIMINQNPETAEVDQNVLKLLKPFTYSKFKIKFGLYVKPEEDGEVKVGGILNVSYISK